MIWEAVRVTTAMPTIFQEMTIMDEDGLAERFVDGGLRCNNPIKEVIREAISIFGSARPLGIIVSLGAGHHGVTGLPETNTDQSDLPSQLLMVLKNLALDCERVADDVKRQWKNILDWYFRFNVTHGPGQIPSEEWQRMDEVKTHTKAYIQGIEISEAIDAVVLHLCNGGVATPTLSLGAICELHPFL
jgi:predicted acylesterase/phospholipase RssA